MPTPLMESLAATERLSEVFSDHGVLQAMLDFEAALARAEAAAGIIPNTAAEVISSMATTAGFSLADLSRRSLRAGSLAIPLVGMLTERVRTVNTEVAGFVHWGATSQDVVDSALMLLLKKCHAILATDHERVMKGLRNLAERHAGSAMLGRTLLQPAPPITFGLKAAGWLAAIRRGWARVDSRFNEALYLQFGGASGTLAAIGNRGITVSELLAKELGLQMPDAPWHGHRDRLAAVMAALSIYTASLGKMALDVSLLMQYEVGEAAEPGGEGRGGSSTMPHKRNPTACMLTLAASKRAPGLLANFIAGMVQEQERAIGGWQAEWNSVVGIVQSAGVALESMVEVAEGLTVDVERMRQNIDATKGAIFAEKAMMLLAPEMGRDAAHKLVAETVRNTGSPPMLAEINKPEDYLGSAEAFRLRLLTGKA